MLPNSLPEVREAVVAARARHNDDSAALARGRERLAASVADLKRIDAEDEAAITRHAQRLEKQTREGVAGPLPSLVPSDVAIAAQITAQRTEEAARRMVASLEAAESVSRAALIEAEESLRNAVLAAVGDDANQLAREVERLRCDLKRKEELLSAVRDVPNFRPSAAVFRALRDDVNMPLADLGHDGDWDTSVADLRLRPTPVDAATHWRQRIEQLTNGEPAAPLASVA